jgi:sec-independent protein translocase protein TatA
MRLGFPELLVVLLVVILIFGAKKIPDLGDAVGKAIRNFKKSSSGDDAIDVTPRKSPDQLGAAPPTRGAPQANARDAAKKS